MNSRETFYRNGRMHVLLIAAGSLAILVSAFIDIDGRGVVPFNLLSAHLPLIISEFPDGCLIYGVR